MKKILPVLLLLVSVQIAHASVVSEPEDAFTVMSIADPSASETYYGVLNNFPHTYDFAVEDTLELEAVLATAELTGKDDRLSVLVTRLEKRGVSESGRVTGNTATWTTYYNRVLALEMRESEPLRLTLSDGIYRLEVSSPENMHSYQLKLNGGSSVSYGELFNARKVFDRSTLSVLLSWKVFTPILLIVAGLYLYKRKKKYV